MKFNKKNEFLKKINIKIYKLKCRVLYNKKNKKYEYKNKRNIKNEGVIIMMIFYINNIIYKGGVDMKY